MSNITHTTRTSARMLTPVAYPRGPRFYREPSLFTTRLGFVRCRGGMHEPRTETREEEHG
jgi:hypothetical protein